MVKLSKGPLGGLAAVAAGCGARLLLPLLAAAFVLAAPAGAAQEQQKQKEWTQAQVLLFDTPHLANVTAPQTLSYDFEQRGGSEVDFDDRVELNITENLPDGRKSLEAEFLTGERRRAFAPFTGFRGNPLIMMFLQWDVDRMKESAGGGERYFRNRIRYAFFQGAEVEEAPIELDGESLPGTRILIRPFKDDANRDRFPDLQGKFYEFLVSSKVPGGVYQIRAVVPAEGGAEPLQQGRVTYRDSAG